jgi:hypothetical protein
MSKLRELLRRLWRKSPETAGRSAFDRVEDARVDAAAQGGSPFPPSYVKQDDGRPPH